MTRIKICGLTNADDALAALDAGADLLGFVLAESPRRISMDQTMSILEQLPTTVSSVLVVRDQPLDDLKQYARRARQSWIQLHGNEPPGFAAALPSPVLRRIAVRASDAAADLAARMRDWPAAMHLLDPGAGSGRTFAWSIARGLEGPVFLAGGLTPDNVGVAIRHAQPYGVDVSSGVEASPGRKDPKRVAAFVHAVREADERNHA